MEGTSGKRKKRARRKAPLWRRMLISLGQIFGGPQPMLIHRSRTSTMNNPIADTRFCPKCGRQTTPAQVCPKCKM